MTPGETSTPGDVSRTADSRTENSLIDGAQVRKVGDRYEKQCIDCNNWIGLGPNGADYSFRMHQRSKRCRRTAERKIHQHAKAALSDSPAVPSTPVVPPSLPSATTHILTMHPRLPVGTSHENEDYAVLEELSSPTLYQAPTPVR